MKRVDVREIYYEATATLSDVTRKLDFAGIGVVWLVRTGEKSDVLVYRPVLRYSLALYVVALGCDLLQYSYKAAAWGTFNRMKERLKTPEDKEFKAPATINWITLVLFWAKVVATIGGYSVLLYALAGQLF